VCSQDTGVPLLPVPTPSERLVKRIEAFRVSRLSAWQTAAL